jgi:hypothetical protein
MDHCEIPLTAKVLRESSSTGIHGCGFVSKGNDIITATILSKDGINIGGIDGIRIAGCSGIGIK